MESVDVMVRIKDLNINNYFEGGQTEIISGFHGHVILGYSFSGQ